MLNEPKTVSWRGYSITPEEWKILCSHEPPPDYAKAISTLERELNLANKKRAAAIKSWAESLLHRNLA